MPTTTTLLSTIPGVTVYEDRVAAKLGGVGSAAAYNAWMEDQTVSATNRIRLEYDGVILVEDGATLLICPDGGQITHAPADSVGVGEAGFIADAKTDARPVAWNFNRVNHPLLWGDENIFFETNSSGTGMILDQDNHDNSAPRDDSTWGWAQLLTLAGVKNFRAVNTRFLNPRAFCLYAVGGWTLLALMSEFRVANEVGIGQLDGPHINGSYWGSVVFDSCTFFTKDDALPFNAYEPVNEPELTNYTAAPYLAGWLGGDIEDCQVINCILDNPTSGVRILSIPSILGPNRVKRVTIDGLTGTCRGFLLNADAYETDAETDLGTATIPIITMKNIDVDVNTLARPGWVYIRGNVTTLTIDVDTFNVRPTNASEPLVYIHESSVISNLSWGRNSIQNSFDDFNRTNTDYGGVGNGWTDDDSAYRINNNRLERKTDGGGYNLVRVGESDLLGDTLAQAEQVLGATPTGISTAVGVVTRYQDSGNFWTAVLDSQGGGTPQLTLVKVVGGAAQPPVLQKTGLTLPANTTVRIKLWSIGSFHAMLVDVSDTGQMVSPLVARRDATFAAVVAGTGFTTGAGVGVTPVMDNARAYGLITPEPPSGNPGNLNLNGLIRGDLKFSSLVN